MIVSTRGRYALRIMVELSRHSDYTPLKEIALAQGIPHKYAENIMTALVKAKLADGTRGKNGGYRLTRTPEQYTVAEILAVTETSIAAAACSEAHGASCSEAQNQSCPRAEVCPTLPMWRALDETIENFFRSYTLADLLPKAS